MRRSLAALATALMLASLLGGSPASADPCESVLCAGAARADITPPVTTPLWGYSARAWYSKSQRWLDQRTHSIDTDLYAKALFLRSEGIHTRLYARAIVLKNTAGTKMALVQTDLGAVTTEVHRGVADAVAPLGVGRDFLLISATHTHGGPGAIQQPAAHGLLVGDHFDPRAFKRVVDGIVRAVAEANARLAPARVGIRQGYILDASVNRTLRAHAGTYRGNSPPVNFDVCPDAEAYETDLDALGEAGDCNHRLLRDSDPDHGELAGHPHAIDPTVTVVRVDRTDGVPLGVWSSFAAHGTMVWGDDLVFSGDNQGIAERLVEAGIEDRARAAGRLPDGWEVVAAYANGTEGDIAPSGSGLNRFIRMEDSGRRQARAVLAVYDALATAMADDVALDARWDWLYMTGEGGTSPVAILGAGPDCPFGKDPRFPPEFLPGHGRKCPFLPLSGTGPQWFGLQVLRIGNLVVGSVPGEMTVQMGRRVKKRLLAQAPPGTIPIIAGLANDYMAYLTTPEEYDVQDYEGTFTLWGRLQGPLMSERLGRLADRLFLGQPNPEFVEPPDTSGTQAENVSPLTQAVSVAPAARPAGTVLAEVPVTVERGSVASFAWVGGPPSVEVVPDEPFVRTQRLVNGRWETAFWDEGFEDILDYWREGTEDRWGTQWDVPLDAEAGRYRFLVEGHTLRGGALAHYRVVSREFEVVPSDDLAVVSTTTAPDGLRVLVAYPPPVGQDSAVHLCSAAKLTAACNYRARAAGPATPAATVTAIVDGATVAAVGSFLGPEGAYVFPTITSADVQVVSFTDGYGNAT